MNEYAYLVICGVQRQLQGGANHTLDRVIFQHCADVLHTIGGLEIEWTINITKFEYIS